MGMPPWDAFASARMSLSVPDQYGPMTLKSIWPASIPGRLSNCELTAQLLDLAGLNSGEIEQLRRQFALERVERLEGVDEEGHVLNPDDQDCTVGRGALPGKAAGNEPFRGHGLVDAWCLSPRSGGPALGRRNQQQMVGIVCHQALCAEPAQRGRAKPDAHFPGLG